MTSRTVDLGEAKGKDQQQEEPNKGKGKGKDQQQEPSKGEGDGGEAASSSGDGGKGDGKGKGELALDLQASGPSAEYLARFKTDWVGEVCDSEDQLNPNEDLKEQWTEAVFNAWRELRSEPVEVVGAVAKSAGRGKAPKKAKMKALPSAAAEEQAGLLQQLRDLKERLQAAIASNNLAETGVIQHLLARCEQRLGELDPDLLARIERMRLAGSSSEQGEGDSEEEKSDPASSQADGSDGAKGNLDPASSQAGGSGVPAGLRTPLASSTATSRAATK